MMRPAILVLICAALGGCSQMDALPLPPVPPPHRTSHLHQTAQPSEAAQVGAIKREYGAAADAALHYAAQPDPDVNTLTKVKDLVVTARKSLVDLEKAARLKKRRVISEKKAAAKTAIKKLKAATPASKR
jgi:tRNA U54 and U55 pseudouridine synthase Pus10